MSSVALDDTDVATSDNLTRLRSYWHPVAEEDDIKDSPVGATLLAEKIVLFRAEGEIRAFRDLCPHRGAALSLGSVINDRLVCPYHGFAYDGAGACRYIPSQPKDAQHIPARLGLKQYRCVVSCGLVWVALEEPQLPVPTFPEYYDPGWRAHVAFRQFWNTSAARYIENFTDFSHFPYVHPGSLGDPEHPEVEPFEVERTPLGLSWINNVRLPSSADHLGALVSYNTNLLFPFSVYLRAVGEEGTTILFTATQPITEGRSSNWLMFVRNHSFDRPDDTWTKFSENIWAEDRRVVESQRPEELPVDLTMEVHLRGADAGGVAYRRLLEEVGLEYA